MAKKQTNSGKEPWDSAHKIWLAGLGALSAAGEEGEKLFRTLIDRGERYEARVGEPVRKMRSHVKQARSRAGKTIESIETAFDDRVTSLLGRLGVPTRDEIAELARKVERLTRAVEGQPAPRPRRAAGKKRAKKTGAARTKKTAQKKKAAAKPAR